MENSKSGNVDLDFSFSEVDKSNKKGFITMFLIMLGFTLFSGSMLTGATLGNGLNSRNLILAIAIGNGILAIYSALLAYIGAKTSLSTHLLSKYSFGETGSKFGSLLLTIAQIGWFGVGVSMFSIPVSELLNINVYIVAYISGALMTYTAFHGIKAVAILSSVAVPSILILGGLSIIKATNDIGGISGLIEIEPTQSLTLATAISLCVGSFISGGTLTADFVRFAKSTKSAIITTVIAFFFGNSIMFIFGAIGGMVYGTPDVSDVLATQGFLLIGVIVLGFNVWTTNDNGLYSSSLALSSVINIKKKKTVIINGILGTVFAIFINNNFIGFLSILSTTLPGIGSIIIADYYIVKKRNYSTFENANLEKINYIALASWLIGFVLSNLLPGIPPLNGIIVTIVIYTVTMKFKLNISKG